MFFMVYLPYMSLFATQWLRSEMGVGEAKVIVKIKGNNAHRVPSLVPLIQ